MHTYICLSRYVFVSWIFVCTCVYATSRCVLDVKVIKIVFYQKRTPAFDILFMLWGIWGLFSGLYSNRCCWYSAPNWLTFQSSADRTHVCIVWSRAKCQRIEMSKFKCTLTPPGGCGRSGGGWAEGRHRRWITHWHYQRRNRPKPTNGPEAAAAKIDTSCGTGTQGRGTGDRNSCYTFRYFTSTRPPFHFFPLAVSGCK